MKAPLFVAALLFLAAGASAQRARSVRPLVDHDTPSFRGLGDLPGGPKTSFARGISPDGSHIVGMSLSGNGPEAFLWTLADGMQGLGDVEGGTFDSEAKAVSSYGGVVVGFGTDAEGLEAFRWTRRNGMQALGHLPGGGNNSQAWDVSADGRRIAGFSDGSSFPNEAFLWEHGSGLTELGGLAGGSGHRALAISPDGTTVAGDAVSSDDIALAVCWAGGGSAQFVGAHNGFFPFTAVGMSNDGGFVVGATVDDFAIPEGFRKKKGGGTVNMGVIPYQTLGCQVTNATGGRIVGTGQDGTQTRAWIWDGANGVRDLTDVIEQDYGIDLSGWILGGATDISGDGQMVIGYGVNPRGEIEAFLAVLPLPCRADFDKDGFVNLLDVAEFAGAHANGEPRADFNGDGFVDARDELAFARAYHKAQQTGC